MRKLRSSLITALFVLVFAASAFAQQPFNKNEFVARRGRLFEKIGDGVAVIFAAKGQHYPVKFRQSPDFYYLTGIEEAGAVLVMVGSNKSSILFAPRRAPEMIRAEGPGIWQVEKREEIYGLTRVQPIEEFLPMFAFMSPKAKKLYMLTGSQGNVQNAREELDSTKRLQLLNQSLADSAKQRERLV